MLVCLSVSNITKLQNYEQIGGTFMVGSGMVEGIGDKILVAIQTTMLTTQSEILPLLNKLWLDFDETFRIGLQWYKEQLINFRVIWITCTMLSLQIMNLGNTEVVSCLVRDLHSLSALVYILKSWSKKHMFTDYKVNTTYCFTVTKFWVKTLCVLFVNGHFIMYSLHN